MKNDLKLLLKVADEGEMLLLNRQRQFTKFMTIYDFWQILANFMTFNDFMTGINYNYIII